MKPVFFHLYNDYSGSPKVLKIVLQGLLNRGYSLFLRTSRGGVLDEVQSDHLRVSHYCYRFSKNPLVTIVRYLLVQICSFFWAFRFVGKKDIVFFVNTILPFSAALAGKMMGKPVIYHYHENAYTKGYIYRSLCWIMRKVADRIICVSEYQKSFLKRKEGVFVVPNALPRTFTESFVIDPDRSYENQTVLMIASLKKYKGVAHFCQLAFSLPSFKFVLVLNDTQKAIDTFFKDEKIYVPQNITIYPRQEDVTTFYRDATLSLNLSNKEMVVETFGLTVLEAFSAGLPVIVPTVGGVAELVEDDVNGYRIDVQNLDGIKQKIEEIMTDRELYTRLSQNAYLKSKEFSEENVIRRIEEIMQNVSH